jgi:hypothetical protein
MEITYELTEKDFVEGYRIHRQRSSSGNWTPSVYMFWASILAAVIVGLTNQHGIKGMVILGFMAFAWAALVSFHSRSSVRRQFRNQPAVHGPRTVVFDSEGAHWRLDGGSSDVAWKNYIQSIEGDTQILLYGSPASFIMIPERILDSAQLAELRELLKQNIQPTK